MEQKDLSNCVDRTVLVKKSDVDVPADITKSYTKVELMDPSVKEYYKLYTKNIDEHLGLNTSQLSTSLTNHILFNPMFIFEKESMV